MISIEDIAQQFSLQVVGNEKLLIEKAVSIDCQLENGLTWVKNDKWAGMIDIGAVLINSDNFNSPKPAVTYLVTDKDPKLMFSLILKEYFTPPIEFYLSNCVNEHRQSKQVIIGDYVFIGQNVKLGAGTVIFSNVTIEANSIIGENCVVKPHVSIGTEGMGLELNPENGLLEKFPQIGNAVLEDFVEIGPHSTVRRGALKSTIIGRGTKIGSLSNIGHNCKIGQNCILTSNIITSGSSNVGDNVYIGVNSVVRNGIDIGMNSKIGMGSVVTKTIPDNVVAYGNPAKVIRKNE